MNSVGDNEKNWYTLYPAYINSNRTKVRGRKVPKEKAVPDPKWQEIKDVLETIQGLKVKEEPNKVYPRELDKEVVCFRGRVRYKLPQEDSRFNNKEEVLNYLCEMIPKLKSRSKTAAPQQSNSEQSASNPGKKKKSRK